MTAAEDVRCAHCSRPLTDPESRALGYGPVCAAGVLGYDTHRTPVPRGPRRRKNVDQIPLPLENPVDLETRKAAIDTIARHAIRAAVSDAFSFDRIGWEDYPSVSIHDWIAVAARAKAIAESVGPTAESYDAACEHLTPQVAPL